MKKKGLSDYARLAYTIQHDMIAAALYSGDLKNPAIIVIKPEILEMESIGFTTKNAISKDCIFYENEDEVFEKLDFKKIWKNRNSNMISQDYKDARQSEILIEKKISLDYFSRVIIGEENDIEDLITEIILTKENIKLKINP